MSKSDDPFKPTKRALLAAKKPARVAPVTGRLTNGELHGGLRVLRAVLLRLRWDDQGGFPSYTRKKHKGQHWLFTSSGLGQATPEEHDALFALAGIEPDEVAEGDDKGCSTCGNAEEIRGERHERGYSGPCLYCRRPLMSHWVPVGQLLKRKDGERWLDRDEDARRARARADKT